MSAQPAGAVRNFVTGSLRDVVLSPNAKTAYVSSADGMVTGYDLETGAVTGSWAVGVKLGGMDVSPDGRFLLAAEMDATGQYVNGVYTGSLTVHRVDLVTGVVQDFKTPSPGAAPAYDVAFLSNGKALITQGYSTNGQSYLTSLDWNSGSHEQSKTSYLWGSTVVSSEDYSTAIVNPEMSSLSGFMFAYKSTVQPASYWYGGYGGDVGGKIALSFDGTMSVLNTDLYNISLKRRQNFEVGGDQWVNPGGAAFAPDGKSFFFLDHSTNTIFEFSTSTLIMQRAFSSASGIANNTPGGAFGDTLSVSSDGRYLVVMGQALQVIDLQKVDADGGTGYADSLIGGAGDDVLQGYLGGDLLEGGAGADTLRGGYDDDTLVGGAGNDYLHGGSGTDTVDYSNAKAGIIVSTPAYGTRTALGDGVDTLVSIENIRGGSFADLIVGTSGADRLEGGEGADTLRGGDGGDTLQGGAFDDLISGDGGDDVLDGGAGSLDVVSYESATAGVTIDLARVGVQDTRGAGLDSLLNFEGFRGSSYGDSVVAGAGNDLLDGGAGGDTLSGGEGSDTLVGGLGDDTLDGQGGTSDWADYGAATSAVTVNLSLIGGQNTLGDGADQLVNIENLSGSAFADFLLGDAGSNALDGSAGNDTLSGGAGDDRLIGGTGFDTASYETAATGVTIDLAIQGAQDTRSEGFDTLVGIEAARGSRFADNLKGDALANSLNGGDGDDALDGGDGQDTLSGGSGADTILGGAGNDLFLSEGGGDALDGGGGFDTASYEMAVSGVWIDLSLKAMLDANGLGLATLVNIEALRGSAFGDRLFGDVEANALAGGNGADFIDGGDGNDTMLGEAGDDILWGGGGRDSVVGGAGFDQINGNVGDDTARGGEGNDWVVGGKDQDLLYGETGDDVVYGNLGNDTCYGGEGSDWVRGGQGDDVIDGGSGNDWMAGDRGNDTVSGGAGADKFYFFAGAAVDRVTDFSSAAGDRVLLDAGQAYTLSYTAEGVVIDLGGGDQMILVGVSQASLGDWLGI